MLLYLTEQNPNKSNLYCKMPYMLLFNNMKINKTWTV